MAFASTFLARANCCIEGASTLEGLEHLLHRFWEAGRGQWPDIPLSADTFVCHLAAHVPQPVRGNDFEQLLAQLMPGDLFLACACARGIPAALTAFERHHIASIPSMLAHMKLSATVVDEIRQRVRERLLVGTGGAPRIAEYSGRGTLSNWVRVVSLRAAVSLLRAAHEERRVSDAILELLPAPEADPELETIKRSYQDEFRQALESAFASLPSEHRYLLRLHFVDQLSTTKLGTLFSVNQSTISRRLQGAQQAVYDETWRTLQERLDLSPQELSSMLRAVESQLDLSLSRILAQG